MTETTQAATIEAAALRALLAADAAVLLVDVRTPGEYDSGHIDGALNVPVDRIAEHADRLARAGAAPLVLICQTGRRADIARNALQAAGATNALVLSGGMTTWTNAGGASSPARGNRWSLERQVRFAAGLIVLVAILVSAAWPPARYLAGFVGAGLVFASVTNTCAMGMLLAKLPYNRGRSCDIDAAVGQLIGR